MLNDRGGYGATIATCRQCGRDLVAAATERDGEPCHIGYEACPEHPLAGADYRLVVELPGE